MRLLKILSCLFYTWRFRSVCAHRSAILGLRIVGGGNELKVSITQSHVRNLRIRNNGKNNQIQIDGGGLFHSSNVYIEGDNNIVIVNRACALADLQITIKGNGCRVEIGEDTTSNGTSIYCLGNGHRVIIGCDCMFARGTELWSGDGHSIQSDNAAPQRRDVIMGNHVWVAEYGKVLKGVHLGDGAVLGMCGLLTKDADAAGLYVGIPARKVKDSILWSR